MNLLHFHRNLISFFSSIMLTGGGKGQTQESNAKVCAGQVLALVPVSKIIKKYVRSLLGIILPLAKYVRFTKKTVSSKVLQAAMYEKQYGKNVVYDWCE